MFVHLLILSEFLLLFAVFWYLYLREPRPVRKIKSNTWGAYSPSTTLCRIESADESIHSFVAGQRGEMIFDRRTNRWVPLQSQYADRDGRAELFNNIKHLNSIFGDRR